MTNNQTNPEDDLFNPENCINYRLRRVARMTAKTFDEALKPAGIRNTQFTLLAALNQHGGASIGALSDMLAIDATTLTRNLDLLARRNLVDDVATGDGRVRSVRLTRLGVSAYNRALPLWRETQKSLLKSLKSNRWPVVQGDLKEIEKACAGPP